MKKALAGNGIDYPGQPAHRDFRTGDVRHSQADIGKAQRLLGYAPTHDIRSGIERAMPWYVQYLRYAPEAENGHPFKIGR